MLKSDSSPSDLFNRLSEAIDAITKEQRDSVLPATIDTFLQSGEQVVAEGLDLDEHASDQRACRMGASRRGSSCRRSPDTSLRPTAMMVHCAVALR